jgi:ABC-2 type transport system permease protein
MILERQVRGVVAKRRVLMTLVQRDLRVRYAGNGLGYLWTILDPLAMCAIYFVVFTTIFKARRVGENPYVLFLIIGILAWQWFSASLTDTSRALLAEARLVRSTNLPRELWVVRVVIAKMVEFLLSLPVIMGFFIVYAAQGEAHLHWHRLPYFAVGVVVQFVLLTGIGLILAPITALVTDTQRVVRIFLRFAFYATPVIYTVKAAPETLRTMLMFNPMSGIVELYRAPFFNGQVNHTSVLLSMVISVVVLLVGTVVFEHFEPAVLKEI